MNLETALTPTLEQTLNLIVSSLANFFGTTTKEIMVNAPVWLTKYGWYVTLRNELPGAIAIGFFFGIIFALGYLAILTLIDKEKTNWTSFITIFFFFLGFLIPIAVVIITCLVSPEIVGLEAAIKMLSQ